MVRGDWAALPTVSLNFTQPMSPTLFGKEEGRQKRYILAQKIYILQNETTPREQADMSSGLQRTKKLA